MPRPFLLLAAFFLGMCVQAIPAVHAAEGRVVAWVGSATVTVDQVLDAGRRKEPAVGPNLSRDEKSEVVQDLVDQEILYQRALARGLDEDPKVKKVMVNTLLREDVYGSVRNEDFAEEELHRYFDTHADEFIVPEKVQIQRILLRRGAHTDAEAKATLTAVAARIRAGAAFKEEAASLSEDAYKRLGGDVGFVARSGKPGLDAAVVDRAFAMPEGRVSEPFQTEEGWNLVQVAARREAVERTFEQMKGSVLRKMKNDRLEVLYDAYVATLRAGASFRVDAAAVDQLDVPGSSAGTPETDWTGEEGPTDE